MTIKSIHHVCIQTEQYHASLDFYTRILGFELVKETPNFHGRDFNTWIKQGQFMIELQTPKQGESLHPWSALNSGPVHLAFMVDNVEAEYQRIKALGYHDFKLKNGQVVYQVLGESLFKIKAPEGTEIEMRETDID